MCRAIKTLHNFAPPASDDEIRASALQFVRKISGFTRPSKANEAAFTKAVDTMVSDPGRTAGLFAAKAMSFWRPVWAGSAVGTSILLGGSYVVMMLLAAVGAFLPGPGRFRAVLWSVVGLYALIHLIFWGLIRERNYIEPLLIAFAAQGLLVVADRVLGWNLNHVGERSLHTAEVQQPRRE